MMGNWTGSKCLDGMVCPLVLCIGRQVRNVMLYAAAHIAKTAEGRAVTEECTYRLSSKSEGEGERSAKSVHHSDRQELEETSSCSILSYRTLVSMRWLQRPTSGTKAPRSGGHGGDECEVYNSGSWALSRLF